MNPDPLTDEELKRVLELDALWGSQEATMSQSWAAENELALLCPRIARELIAARAQMAADRNQLRLCEAHAGTMAVDFDAGVKVMRAQIAADAEKLRIAWEAMEWVRDKDRVACAVLSELGVELGPESYESQQILNAALAQLTPKP